MSGSDALDMLVRALDAHERLAIAVSGGVDSMTLAHVAHGRSRSRPTMVHAFGPAVPASARERVERHAARHGWDLRVLDAGEYDDERYRANPANRCYYCKSNLYDRIREDHDGPIASGTNLDDLDDYRPGLAAARERGVVHPYVEAGLDKSAVYSIAGDARALGPRATSRPALPREPRRDRHRHRPSRPRFRRPGRGAARADRWEAMRWCAAASRTPGWSSRRQRIDAEALAVAREVAARACTQAGRPFAGVRPYRRGAAFLRGTDGG